MPLILRQKKGSKLTIAEMDGNLEYLQANGFVDGQYSQTVTTNGVISDINFIQFSDTLTDAAEGLYEVEVGTQTGNGDGAVLDLHIIDNAGTLEFDFAGSSIIAGGVNYNTGDVLAIAADQIGGASRLKYFLTLLDGSVSDLSLSADISTDVTTDSSQLQLSSNAMASATIYLRSYNTGEADIELTTNNCNLNLADEKGASITGENIDLIASGVLTLDAQRINLSSIPTTDPLEAGLLWVDAANGYVLKVSQGPL
jgi:hypothetical protein